VDGDQGLEGLHLVGQDGQDAECGPDRRRAAVVPRVDDGLCGRSLSVSGDVATELIRPKGRGLLRTCFCFGAVSSGLVAFLRATWSSASALSLSTGLVGLWDWFL
jgi:hypothetical protein